MRLKQISLILLGVFFLSGCYEKPLPDNVVATVNGKSITLHTVQSLQEIEFTDFNYQGKPSLEKLRKQYGATLSTIILYEIILQDLESKGYAITDEQVAEYEKTVLEGYTKGEFDKYVTENAINVDTWRVLLKYQLALNLFKDLSLHTAYVPTVEEVEKYYTENRKKFSLAKSYTLRVASSEAKENLENINNLQELLDKDAKVDQYSLTLKESAMPQDIKKSILNLTPLDCTDIFEENESFNRICLIKINDGEDISITRAYSYIENQLVEERLDELLYTWLEQSAQKFEVKISTHLIKEIM